MSAHVGVASFPGSNCEYDVIEALERVGARASIIWHQDRDLADCDAIVIPGGFAHGDYLRCGAIARFSPVMESVAAFAREGGPVLGICNGFQVLTEAGLLPGVLVRNAGLRFVSGPSEIEVAAQSSVLTAKVPVGTRLRLPINHGEGNFTCDLETLEQIERQGQVVLRYVDNPNGSMNAIAGVANREGNVVGLMPHPERACDPLLGSIDGLALLSGFVDSAERAAARQRASVGN